MSAREVARETPLRGQYWASQIREPVRFRECILEARRAGCNLFLEIGPAGVLSTLIRSAPGSQAVAIASLDRNKDDNIMMLRALGEMHCLGVNVDLRRGGKAADARHIALPKYPFQRQSHPLNVADPALEPGWKGYKPPDRDITPMRRGSAELFDTAAPDAAGIHDASRDQDVLILATVARVCGMDVAAIQL